MPGRALLRLFLFLLGASAAFLGLVQARSQFEFHTFTVGAIPVERVRSRADSYHSPHFLLLHGYLGNRRQLLHLAQVLTAAGGEAYVVDLPGRGDNSGAASALPPEGPTARLPTPRETQAALAVVRVLEEQYGVRPDRLVVVGHSMGGGVALELGRRLAPLATVSLSGLERPVAPGQPPNLLLITARLDFPPLRRAADRMYARARGGGAVGWREFPAIHSSLPYHSSVQREVVELVNRALPGADLRLPLWFNEWLLALEATSLFFLIALFVPLSQVAGWRLAGDPFGEVVAETRISLWTSWQLGGYALVSGGAVVSALALLHWLGWAPPLSFLHLSDGDYLASVLLLSTVWLLPALARPPWVRDWRETARKTGAALLLALYVVIVGGGFLTWQLFDLWPTPTRFARLLALTLLLLPFAFAEELLLIGCDKQEGVARALSGFLLWRVALVAAIAYGAAVLDSGRGMLVLATLPLLLLFLLEHFFSARLRRDLGSVYAVATFKAVLLGWVIATVFPLR